MTRVSLLPLPLLSDQAPLPPLSLCLLLEVLPLPLLAYLAHPADARSDARAPTYARRAAGAPSDGARWCTIRCWCCSSCVLPDVLRRRLLAQMSAASASCASSGNGTRLV
eukprot:TRINITY_DN333_c1_g1_i3.p4 TRINITY_DN333_c1_g1~~TRINITY_DN333_c1_g1_i3.p4  ORF type:complete len:110 (-),score=36.56 TRINITY_DN333_c1_g1_i3:74-403(-)